MTNSTSEISEGEDLAEFVPREVYPLANPQTDIPRIAKDRFAYSTD